MILGYHVCFSAYGFWLPNDPRGSGSRYVGAKHLLPFGGATGLSDRSRSVAARDHDRRRREQGQGALKYPAVRFNGIQALAIGQAFGKFIGDNRITVRACAVLPDHVHLVVAGLRYEAETLTEQLKGAATRRLIKDGIHPFGGIRLPNGRAPKCWGRGGWKVFLDSDSEIEHEIHYVEQNPLKEGLRRQNWSFVTPFGR